MIRIKVICEGPTEQEFVGEVLRPHYVGQMHWDPMLAGKASACPQGGDVRWGRVWPDLVRAIKQDPTAVITTLFDFYGLGSDFPGRQTAYGRFPAVKAKQVERGILEFIQEHMGGHWNPHHFVPYIQMHEFEGILFSDPAGFAASLYSPELEPAMSLILAAAGGDPEAINDGPTTAPSKRIVGQKPDYNKVLHGNIAAMAVGLETIRSSCRHFNEWLSTIELLAQEDRGA